MPGVSAHPLGATAAAIVRDDLSRLSPGRYLNDSIIEVGLNLWLIELEQTNPALAESIHIFTPFFIKKLDPGNGTDICRYNRVRKWTRNFDLFKKKYIFVPINETLHWYLALICHPEHTVENLLPEIFDVDNLSEAGARTHIFSLDSLGYDHARVLGLLANYLRLEALDKLQIPWNRSRVAKLKKAEVPRQINGFDCGVHVVHLARKFMSDLDGSFAHVVGPNSANHWGRPSYLRQTLIHRIQEVALRYKGNSGTVVLAEDVEAVDSSMAASTCAPTIQGATREETSPLIPASLPPFDSGGAAGVDPVETQSKFYFAPRTGTSSCEHQSAPKVETLVPMFHRMQIQDTFSYSSTSEAAAEVCNSQVCRSSDTEDNDIGLHSGAPPAKRSRLTYSSTIAPAERPMTAQPRALSSSKKRGKRSGCSRRTRETDLGYHRGLKEAEKQGKFGGQR